MKKEFWKDLVCVLASYLVFAYLISSNWGTFKYLPGFVVIGAFGVFFLIGGLLHRKERSVGAILAMLIPHVIADVFYIIGLNLKSSVFIGIFRQIVPHVQSSMKFVDQIGFDGTRPSTKIAIATIMIIPLSYLSFSLGIKLRDSGKSLSKWLYNNILVWVVHFILFVVLTNIVTVFPTILTEDKVSLLFAFVSTTILFVAYFFTGRACRTIKNPVGQFTSMISVTVTSAILYIGTLFLLINSGVFERYILPVATSFIGIICKQIGLMTGASCTYVSQYGILATLIMLIAPAAIIYLGKLASMPDKNKEHEQMVQEV